MTTEAASAACASTGRRASVSTQTANDQADACTGARASPWRSASGPAVDP